MKIKSTGRVLLTCGALLVAQSLFAQTNLNFTPTKATVEGAIQLSWQSTSNEVYGIEYANELVDTNTGLITWHPLYSHYPSHGTNTFWLDTGNYHLTPAIPHPKTMPMRFYRIFNEGTNDGPGPYVVITAPTNSSSLSGQITVSVIATSELAAVTTKLYIDGEEMKASEDGTNYVINTCEWANGSHTLFATAKAQSAASGRSGSFPITIGQNVSSYVAVSFDNLISRISFSERFFEPSLGQTQHVAALFAANSDWTLQIIDEDSNVWRTATGSGTRLNFAWDGSGETNATIPDGVYYYQITATTNGMSSFMPMGSSMRGTIEEPTEVLAVSDYSILPLYLYPEGMDTNGLIIVEAKMSELNSLLGIELPPDDGGGDEGGGGGIEEGPMAFSGSSQSATAPTRNFTAPTKNALGNFSVVFYTFPTPRTLPVPTWGPQHTKIAIEGSKLGVVFPKLPEADTCAVAFVNTMIDNGWKIKWHLSDSDIHINSLRRSDLGIGGGDLFTEATIGFFMNHGSFGTDPDSDTAGNGKRLTYFPSGNTDDTSNPWLRMSQIGMGGNLKWLGILACNSLCDPNYTDMKMGGCIPLKETHLICGTTTIVGMGNDIGQYWALNMTKGKQLIREAWFNAGSKQYHAATSGINTGDVMGFRVTGYPECIDDTLKTNTAPTSPTSIPTSLVKRDQQVYP